MSYRILNKTVPTEELEVLDWIIWNGKARQVAIRVSECCIMFTDQTWADLVPVPEVIRLKVEITL